jgi:hypothetical protein
MHAEKLEEMREETHPRSGAWIVGQPEFPFLRQQQA